MDPLQIHPCPPPLRSWAQYQNRQCIELSEIDELFQVLIANKVPTPQQVCYHWKGKCQGHPEHIHPAYRGGVCESPLPTHH